MAFVVTMRWPGVTVEQYDQVRKLVDWEGNRADGGILHIAYFDDQGLRATDVWESAEQFQRFVQDRLMPGTVEAGAQGQPEVEVFPAHAVYNPDAQSR
jgi:hypothetical protein